MIKYLLHTILRLFGHLVELSFYQFGPYIKYKSLNATIPEEKDPAEITMDDAIILIEKRKDYDRNKKNKRKGKK